MNKDLLQRYFEEVVDMRIALHHNTEDSAYAENEYGEIRYIFDSNIIIFFLNPLNEPELVDFFGQQDMKDTLPTAVSTAEFLFSRSLAGQRAKAPLITDDHMNHVLGRIEKTYKKLLGTDVFTAKEIDETPEPDIDLTGAFENLSPDEPEEYVNALASITEELQRSGLGSLHELQSFNRLVSTDLVMPIRLDPLVTSDILTGYEEMIDQLKRSLRKYRGAADEFHRRHRRSTANGRRSRPSNKAISSDINAIAMATALNERVSCGPKPVKYVFVTADKTLFEAYSNWYWESGSADRGDNFVVRRISQYVPTLNVQDMPNHIDKTIIGNMRNSLDSLLRNVRKRDYRSSYPEYLATYTGYHKRLHSIGEKNAAMREYLENIDGFLNEPLRRDHKVIDALRSDWRRLARTAGALNPKLLYDRHRALNGIQGVLGKQDFNESALKLLQDILNDVELYHAQLALPRNLREWIARASRNRQENPNQNREYSPRGYNLIRTDFKELTDNQPIGAFLVKLSNMNRESQKTKIETIIDGVRSLPDYDTMLLASCFAFASNAWDAAYHYAMRAHRMIWVDEQGSGLVDNFAVKNFDDLPDEKKKTLPEIEFFLATTLRHHVMADSISANYRRLSEVERLLDSAFSRYRLNGDKFGEGCVLADKAYLRLMAAFDLHAVYDEDRTNIHLLEEAIGPKIEWANSAQQLLDKANIAYSEIKDASKDNYSVSALRLTIRTLEASCFILHTAYPYIRLDNDRQTTNEVLENLRAEKASDHLRPAVYDLTIPLLELSIERSATERKKRRKKAFELLTAASKDRENTMLSDRKIMQGLMEATGFK